ncbi:MAG: hypothetical protein ONB16_09255 [candidate division KSB1 bacterium]|nr:hypothetical protein [candidate division KSB1 bacterium]MDZ7318732.1 hypothetical protein [candidate division KSB1 bacterium]MDZ7342140.1 hypothetical protein [candidate division KSB1 bacterium]
MKNVISKWLLVVSIIWASAVLAQDIQETYDAAKAALLRGDYQVALVKISDARAHIAADPQLDPNGVFQNRLLPNLENDANTMASIITALEELYSSTEIELVFPDLKPNVEAVHLYTQQARSASEQLISRRDSILASVELAPEYRDALRNTVAFKQIERLASVEIVEKLSEKFTDIALVLTDSIAEINSQYQTLAANLEKLKKASASSQAERKKLEEKLAALSQERANYMNAISEMLIGDNSTEKDQMRIVLMDQNLSDIFGTAITTEIKRVNALGGAIDSSAYRDIIQNYERMKRYNEIFMKNNVAGDQSALLAQYEAAIKNIKVVQPTTGTPIRYFILAVIGLILIFVIYKIVTSQKTKRPTVAGSDPSAPHAT